MQESCDTAPVHNLDSEMEISVVKIISKSFEVAKLKSLCNFDQREITQILSLRVM